jgi:defect-in-organelle-trafficking protein DotC
VDLHPRSKEDEKSWDKGYRDGMATGVAEARASFKEAVRRMRRDYEGMLRYHDLARRGAISMPSTVENGRALRVSKNGTVALVGMRRIELVVTPKFRPQAGAGSFPVGSADVTMRPTYKNFMDKAKQK